MARFGGNLGLSKSLGELGKVWEQWGAFRSVWKGSGEHLGALRSIWKSLRQFEEFERVLQGLRWE